ncbi:MAG: hypothetical protein KIS61_37245 [Candidatus Eremiobacteraeota bacterium]|nr:hypothetical protein [Candidatus Eremiobacteraeota bacterium]
MAVVSLKKELIFVDPVAEGPLPGFPIATPYGMEEIPYGIFASEIGIELPNGAQYLESSVAFLVKYSLEYYCVALAKASFESTLLCRRERRERYNVTAERFKAIFTSLMSYHLENQCRHPAFLSKVTEDWADLFIKKGQYVWVVSLTEKDALVVSPDLEIEPMPRSCLMLQPTLITALEREGDIYNSSKRFVPLPERMLKLLGEK